MSSVASRHSGDLGGLLGQLDEQRALAVRVVIDPAVADRAAVQHGAWMLINLLVRMDGIVSGVRVHCPADCPARVRVSPLAEASLDLRSALITAGNRIGLAPVTEQGAADLDICVGPGDQASWLRVHGNGWCAGISPSAMPDYGRRSALPFGPYFAACLAAAEVFLFVRLKAGVRAQPAGPLFYSLWEHRTSGAPVDSGPSSISATLDFALAGVGAVGNAWLHALWAIEQLTGTVVLADCDEDGIDATNLNRYVLFGRFALGRQKADEAARLLSGSAITWVPRDQPLETIVPRPRRVIAAVDTKPARAAIQELYPYPLIFASTKDLRAEVVRCEPSDGGPCMRCYNDPADEPNVPDAQVAQDYLSLQADEQRALAEDAGVEHSEALAWARAPTCGSVDQRILPLLRAAAPRPQLFAVGFSSVAAGILLAVETTRISAGLAMPLPGPLHRSSFQFVRPSSVRNGASAYLRDPNCPMCDPERPGAAVWRRRARECHR